MNKALRLLLGPAARTGACRRCAVVIALVMLSMPALGQTSIGLGGHLFSDSSDLEDIERIGPSRDIDRSEGSNVGVLSVSLWVLHALDDTTPRRGFRVGGELHYRGGYAFDPDADNRDTFGLGSVVEASARGEWSTRLMPKLGFGFGLELGLAMLVVGDELEESLEALQAQGVETSTGPRFGFVAGPSVFGTYDLLENLLARLDLGLSWQSLYLIGVDETVQGVAFARDMTLSTVRFEVTIGIELTL